MGLSFCLLAHRNQAWRGHAKTRTLVLALRDYLVARADQANKELLAVAPASKPTADSQDPETAMGAALPDSWMVHYMHVKQLRNLQRKIFFRSCELICRRS